MYIKSIFYYRCIQNGYNTFYTLSLSLYIYIYIYIYILIYVYRRAPHRGAAASPAREGERSSSAPRLLLPIISNPKNIGFYYKHNIDYIIIITYSI